MKTFHIAYLSAMAFLAIASCESTRTSRRESRAALEEIRMEAVNWRAAVWDYESARARIEVDNALKKQARRRVSL